MRYEGVSRGRFLKRPNRFLADVETDGRVLRCHVKNTGRLRELLIPGAPVWIQKKDAPGRKTGWDLISVGKETDGGSLSIVNIDSQAPNEEAARWIREGGLFPRVTEVKRERRFGDSRFDLYIEAGGERSFMEVKGVTLDAGGRALFPDAPTERGVKHVEELIKCAAAGFGAYLLFVIQMKGIREFSPNENTHPEFVAALRRADQEGVRILAYDCAVTEDSMTIDAPVRVRL